MTLIRAETGQNRRQILKFGAAAAALTAVGWPGAGRAQAGAPFRIGFLSDMSGMVADLSGAGSVAAAELALADRGGQVLGRPVEIVTGDHLNKPDVGIGIARKWYDEGVEAIFDVGITSVALGVQQLAREKNKSVIFISSSSAILTGENCSPNGIHWNHNSYSQAIGVIRHAIASGNDSFYFLTVDYAYRLLRHLQPRQRDPRRPAGDADHRDRARGHPDDRRHAGLRCHRLCHRLRRADRRAVPDRYPGQGRAGAEGQMGGRPPELSGPDEHGLPQPLHRDRAAQPLGAVERHRLHRAACGVDRRLSGLAAGPRHRPDRGGGRGRGRLGGPCPRGGGRHALSQGQFLVSGRQRAGQAPRLHALYRRQQVSADREEVAAQGYAGFILSRPAEARAS